VFVKRNTPGVYEKGRASSTQQQDVDVGWRAAGGADAGEGAGRAEQSRGPAEPRLIIAC
jgi:hypothetical protein